MRGRVLWAEIRANRARAGRTEPRPVDCTTCGDTGTAVLLHGGVHKAAEPCPDCVRS